MTTLPKPPELAHISDEEWDERIEAAVKAAGEPPQMTPQEKAQLEQAMRNNLRVIWREPDGLKRRCTTFVPIDRNRLEPDFLRALDKARMTVTVRGFEEGPEATSMEKN